MKSEDKFFNKNLDKALNEDDLDAVAGGAYVKSSSDRVNDSVLAASVSACSVQSANNGSDAFAPNNK